MPIPESAKVTPALSEEELDAMSQEVQAFEAKLQKRQTDASHAFKQGYAFYQSENYHIAMNYFAVARQPGSTDAAYYEGTMNECGAGYDINP